MTMDLGLAIALIVVALLLGLASGYFIKHHIEQTRAEKNNFEARNIIDAANKKAAEITEKASKKEEEANKKASEITEKASRREEEANRRAEEIINNATNQARNLTIELKKQAEQEEREKRAQLAATENKLSQREANLDRRDLAMVERENNLDRKIEECNNRFKKIELLEKEVQEKEASIDSELEKIANMNAQEAREIIIEKVESKMAVEIASLMKQMEDDAKEKCDSKAKEMLCLAMAKYSQEVVTEKTVSVVAIPNDEMKGRIIGREGRNIRTLEQLLGVDILIDDTPEVIQVSCFDPIRRETARLALEYLIKDGRIQPGRIEEIVEKAKQDVAQSCHEAGINAAFKLGLPRINKDLLDLLGKLKYRTSFTQNALDHSMQVAYLCGIMAAELGLDQNLAKRAGLLHDIGKAADFEMDGSHVEIGARLAKKYGEPEVVINAIESHHGDEEAKFIISTLVQAADTLSAARPGARNETLENYIQRIEKLEEITKSFEGVQSSFAMQSGRELRIMVVPEKINDAQTYKLARDIKEKIEAEMTYPGQIKVSVIRETRATEVAK